MEDPKLTIVYKLTDMNDKRLELHIDYNFLVLLPLPKYGQVGRVRTADGIEHDARVDQVLTTQVGPSLYESQVFLKLISPLRFVSAAM
jgi:hypothetical protein